MSWNATSLAAWRNSPELRRELVKIDLTAPSSLTLYLSDSECAVTHSGNSIAWEAVLGEVGDVVVPGDFLSSSPDPCTFEFVLKPEGIGAAGGLDARTLLYSYQWEGATVTAYRWVVGLGAFETYAMLRFVGAIELVTPEEDFKYRVACVGRTDWSRDVPADVVGRSIYPRAPEKSVGRVVPICYGKLRTPEARPPASDYGLFQQGITSVAGGRRAGVRGTVVRGGKGNGGEKGRVLFASHACKVFNVETSGSTPFMEDGDKLCDLDPDGANVVNGSDGTGFDFVEITSADADPFVVWLPIFAADAQLTGTNDADGPRHALDLFNDASYTLLDYNNNQRVAKFRLPDVPAAGIHREWYIVLGYSFTSGTSLSFDIVNPTSGFSDGVFLAGGSTGLNDKTAASLAVSTAIPAGNPWNLGSDGVYIRVQFNGANAGKQARLFYCGLAVKRRPIWPVVTPASTYTVHSYSSSNKAEWLFPLIGFGYSLFKSYHSRKQVSHIPEVDRVDADFLATLDGWADDGSGTDTGAADALIERPTDVLRHFLATYCGQSRSTQIDSTALDALRSDLVTWKAKDMLLAYAIDERRRTGDVIDALMASVLSRAYVSRITNKWTAFSWKSSKSVTYDIPIRREDLLRPPVIERRSDLVCNQFQISYGMDAWSRRPVHDVRMRHYESNSGHFYRNLRDGLTTVTASQTDKLDFSDGTSRTVTLTTGAYYPIDLAQHVAGLISAVTTNGVCQIAWGFEVVASYNDQVAFNDGSSRTATLTAGSYTGATLATEIAAKMNGVSSGWTCTYSSSTGKFTITKASGTAQLKWGTTATRTAATMLGFSIADKTGSLAYTSDFAVYPQQFAIGLKTSTLSLLFETGSNGIDATTPRTCGALFGFDTSRDYAEGVSYAVGHSPVTAGEAECLISARGDGTFNGYGDRPARLGILPAVYDTDTAREIRERLKDLTMPDGGTGAPVLGTFVTDKMPDFERGDVFTTNQSIDDWTPFTLYGSDGSWEGKKWLVVSGVDHASPAYQEVIALLVD